MLLIIPLLFGYASSKIWSGKGGSPGAGFLLGFFLGIIGLVIVAVATPSRAASPPPGEPPVLEGGHEVRMDAPNQAVCREPGCGFTSITREEARAHRLATGALPEPPPLVGGHEVRLDAATNTWICREADCGFTSMTRAEARAHRSITGASPAIA